MSIYKYLDGADIVVDQELIEQIKNGGEIPFQKFICTPDCVNLIKPAARYLGPVKLMPNPKLGTVVPNDQLVQLVKDAKKGVVTFRVND